MLSRPVSKTCILLLFLQEIIPYPPSTEWSHPMENYIMHIPPVADKFEAVDRATVISVDLF